MTFSSDGTSHAPASFVDADTADVLLAGGSVPGFEDLVALLSAAKSSTCQVDAALEDMAVAALTRAGGTGATVTPLVPFTRPVAHRRHALAKLMTFKSLAIAGAIVIGGTAAAATAGSLPRPVQSAIARTLHHVGVRIHVTRPPPFLPLT